jgi:antitoxin (DNA-binding transcriptional repressor) of toxin-antitoxin stability system
MKIAGIRELRAKAAALLGGSEPVLITRHGKVSGVYVPLDSPDTIPDDLRREMATVVGNHLHRMLKKKKATEKKILEDFDDHRRRRR